MLLEVLGPLTRGLQNRCNSTDESSPLLVAVYGLCVGHEAATERDSAPKSHVLLPKERQDPLGDVDPSDAEDPAMPVLPPFEIDLTHGLGARSSCGLRTLKDEEALRYNLIYI